MNIEQGIMNVEEWYRSAQVIFIKLKMIIYLPSIFDIAACAFNRALVRYSAVEKMGPYKLVVTNDVDDSAKL